MASWVWGSRGSRASRDALCHQRGLRNVTCAAAAVHRSLARAPLPSASPASNSPLSLLLLIPVNVSMHLECTTLHSTKGFEL